MKRVKFYQVNQSDSGGILEVWKRASKIVIIHALFFEIEKDWFYVYERVGSSSSPSKGNIIRKIDLRDCEYEMVICSSVRFEKLREEIAEIEYRKSQCSLN